jgi:hypothetical protein
VEAVVAGDLGFGCGGRFAGHGAGGPEVDDFWFGGGELEGEGED